MRFALLSVVLIGALLLIGWRQPLRYRFMSKADIYALEHPTTPTPIPTRIAQVTPAPPWMWDPSRRTPLDKGSYNRDYSVPPSARYYYTGRYITPYPTR